MRKADSIFLSTSSNWDLESLLQTLPKETVPVALIMVKSRENKTGMNEEYGVWIQELWQRVITKCPEIVGHRLSWDELVFFWPNKTADDLEYEIVGILKDSCVPQLKSLALFSVISDTKENALHELERMDLQLGKIGYWKEHIFNSYYEDGRKILLYATTQQRSNK